MNATAHKRPVIYFGYEPDAVAATLDGQAVGFARETMECKKAQSFDPTLTGGTCGSRPVQLMKVAPRTFVEKDGDLKKLC